MQQPPAGGSTQSNRENVARRPNTTIHLSTSISTRRLCPCDSAAHPETTAKNATHSKGRAPKSVLRHRPHSPKRAPYPTQVCVLFHSHTNSPSTPHHRIVWGQQLSWADGVTGAALPPYSPCTQARLTATGQAAHNTSVSTFRLPRCYHTIMHAPPGPHHHSGPHEPCGVAHHWAQSKRLSSQCGQQPGLLNSTAHRGIETPWDPPHMPRQTRCRKADFTMRLWHAHCPPYRITGSW